MTRSLLLAVIICASLAMLAAPARAETGTTMEEFSSGQLAVLGSGGYPPESILAEALMNPETLNKVLEKLTKKDSQWKILKDLNIRFKTFTAKDDSESLGFSYGLSKSKTAIRTSKTDSQTGYSVSINLEGNVAFDKEANPNDFLDSNVSAHVFHSRGGVIETTPGLRDRLNDLESKLAGIEDKEALYKSAEFREFSAAMLNHMTEQYYFDLSVIGGLESNQDFTQKEYYYGGQLGVDVKAWNPASSLARYNVFDWPFAAFRWLTDNDDAFTPRGSTIPTVLVGVDLVDPQAGVIKELHGDKSSFARFRAEGSFRTPLKRYNEAFFEANYRYFRELNAPVNVTDQGLEKFGYFAAAVVLQNGMFVSYSKGRLPLDVQRDAVYELGYKFSF